MKHASTGMPARRHLLLAYYAGTLAFVALDVAAGLNVRTSFLENLPGWRAAYYLFCFACFGLIWRFPGWTSVIAVTESCVNLSGLIIHTASRIFAAPDIALDGGPPITGSDIVNFMLTGGIAYVGLAVRARHAKADLESGKAGF